MDQSPLRSTKAFYGGGTIPWFKTGELNDGYLSHSEELITERALRETAVKLFPAETVLMAMYGDGDTITRLGMLREPATTNQACAAMILDEQKCVPRYLFYALKATRDELVSLANGGAQRNLSCKVIKEFTVPAPPLSIQREIADVLGALDDKIELNRQTCATLEEIARAIFRSWFVDFDPVRAKIKAKPEGRDPEQAAMAAISGKCDPETLPADTFKPLRAAALPFPSSLVESEAGPIPNGWEAGRLDDMLVLQRGFDLPADLRKEGPYPILASSGPSGSHVVANVRGPGVTTGRSGIIGNVFFVHEDFWPLNTSLWVKEFKRCTPSYAFHLLLTVDFSVFAAGSAVPTLNRNHIHNLRVTIPPEPVIRAFDGIASSILRTQKSLTESTLLLGSIRDALLPRLLSGSQDPRHPEINTSRG